MIDYDSDDSWEDVDTNLDFGTKKPMIRILPNFFFEDSNFQAMP
jgi:hypothetical protein